MGRDRNRYRLEMESVFSPEDLASIANLTRAHDRPFDAWVEIGPIARPYEVLAVQLWTDRLVTEEGFARGLARELACSQCGVSWETIRCRIKAA